MTNGIVVVLGPTGGNIGSGMTGGVAYLYAPGDDQIYLDRLKSQNVAGRRVLEQDSPAALSLKDLVEQHHAATGSKHAASLLEDFDASQFIQVIPPSEIDLPKNQVVVDAVGERVAA